MGRRKLNRIKGLVILIAGRFLSRYLPIGSLTVTKWLFKQFRSNKTTVAYQLNHAVIVIPGVASCWRDVVNGREYALQTFLSSLASRTTGFLDCGANIGYFSCLMARLNPKARVIAVEPLKECRSYLRAVIRINKLLNIEIVEAVLSDSDGTFEFGLPEERFSESASLSRAAATTGLVQVQGYSLDSLLRKFATKDRVIVKVDIEGFESVALNNSISPENAQKVIALFVEVHLCRFLNPRSEFADLLSSLQAWFFADWFIATPRCLQGSLKRYWNRVYEREEIMPLSTGLVNQLIKNKQVGELYLFGIRN